MRPLILVLVSSASCQTGWARQVIDAAEEIGTVADASPAGVPRMADTGLALATDTSPAEALPAARDGGPMLADGPVHPPVSACASISLGAELPAVLDCTSQRPNARVPALVRRGIDGLGFSPREGPRAGDLIFVGDQYMAWIDRTGYFGKLNALWVLGGAAPALDFTLAEPGLSGLPRPVSVLLPGEDGDGRWPAAYNGAEHYEIPRYMGGAHVAQAGLREANHFGTGAPETWRQCINADGSMARWDAELGKNTTEVQPDGTVVVTNSAPLSIVCRFRSDAFACGSAFPFNDEQPGHMELVQGYVLDARGGRIQRTYQLLNRSAHDYRAQTSVDKLIGGFLLTDWPRPHYLKQFHRFGAWDSDALAREERFPYSGTGQTSDHIDVHAQGKRWLSATATPVAGRSVRIEQGGGLGDVGHCLCRVHGGFELGGSVLANLTLARAADPSTPTVSPVHRRALYLEGDRSRSSVEIIQSRVLQGEEPTATLHQVGVAEGAHWVAATGPTAGFLYYRNYLLVPAGAVGQAAFVMDVDVVNGPDEPVVRIDIVHEGVAVIASREILRSQFKANETSQRFVLDFETPGTGSIEPRVMWYGRARIRLDGIVVNWVDPER